MQHCATCKWWNPGGGKSERVAWNLGSCGKAGQPSDETSLFRIYPTAMMVTKRTFGCVEHEEK